jgi:hypothetical protein
MPSGATSFVLENAQRASKSIIRSALFFSVRSERNQRTERKRGAVFFGQTNHRGVMTMGKTGQARLQRHRNIGGTEIEHNDTEAAGAQKLFAGPRDTFSIS